MTSKRFLKEEDGSLDLSYKGFVVREGTIHFPTLYEYSFI